VSEPLTIQANQLHEVPGETIFELNQGFEWLSTAPNAYTYPEEFEVNAQFRPAVVPGTVAMHIEDERQLSSLDAIDHWYRCIFNAPSSSDKKTLLQFDGLLTYADVYLNGQLILQSRNAYHSHFVDITAIIKASNQLAICFRAIQSIYSAKHPRARYMTRLVNERHLRFIRTPVLGYTPGFSSATKAVGPYRPIRLISQNQLTVISSLVNTQLIGNDTGQVDLNLTLQIYDKKPLAATLILADVASKTLSEITLNIDDNGNNTITLTGQLLSNSIKAYWPHTHGEPHRYLVKVKLASNSDTSILNLGFYGFKRVERINQDKFSLNYNGMPIFFRGACWTPMDPVSLLVSKEKLLPRLTLLRNAGINMLRIPGNMLYESDDFYALCDELGILIFQDFAFTNFDYPETEDFITSVHQEVTTFLLKHGGRPCMTVLSGGSEVAQQASMMGLVLEEVHHPLFTEHIPAIVSKLTPYLPYAISSPYSSHGLPFHAGDGPCSYHGVGGYLRSFEDARAFKGQFISECLPFSNIPEDESLRKFWDGDIPPPHHPLWKEGVARDPGSGWDFSDITDFYLEKLFDVDPVKLRAIDQDRYLAYCRATVVETVETTMSIFRADSANGRAALVWNLHDLKPGAGWGYIDSLGQSKSTFYALARSAQPTTVLFIDEGLEGLAIYLAHEHHNSLPAELSISLVTDEGKIYAQNAVKVTLSPRSISRMSIDTIIGRFVDSSYAYHFGPRAFVSCVAQLKQEDDTIITQKTYTPPCETQTLVSDAGLTAMATKIKDGEYLLTISTQSPAYYVAISIENFALENNYFHVLPGFDQQVKITNINVDAIPRGRLRALNVKASSPIKVISN
jgi:beta-mannosidase